MRKKHDFNIFPLIFEKIIDFQVNMAAKKVRLPPFYLQHSDADGYGAFTRKTTKQILNEKGILLIIFFGTVGKILKL